VLKKQGSTISIYLFILLMSLTPHHKHYHSKVCTQ